jgi:flagellin
MRINYNVSAMISNNALSNNDNLLAKSLERLSSGLKINHAKDGPSGLAMAKKMNAQIESLAVARQNASDGISIIETADGALTEVHDMLQRINELAVKAANGTMTDDDRATIQSEVDQLMDEITRISETTEFNGQPLLNGQFENKGYTNMEGVKVSGYTDDVPKGVYTISSLTVTKQDNNGVEESVITDGYDLGDDFPQGTTAEIADNLLTITGPDGFKLTMDLTDSDFAQNGSITLDGLEIETTGIGAMRLQIGANEGQALAVDIPAMTLRNMSIENIDVSTLDGARDAISRVDEAIRFTSQARGKMGAFQNRLESTVNSLNITGENMTAAYSRIMDVDMAEEMTVYSTNQVLTQAGTSMLAQANERPSQVLQLLQ